METYIYIIAGIAILFALLWLNKRFWEAIDNERLEQMRREANNK